MAATPARPLDGPPRLRTSPTAQVLRQTRPAAVLVGLLAAAIAVWECYKALGQAAGGRIPGTSVPLPVATDDLAMPHVADILGSLFEPVRTGVGMTLGSYLVQQAMVTLQESLAGLLIGALAGVALAMIFLQAGLLRRGFMPWVVASQTVPLVAIAPMIVIWSGKAGLPGSVAVAAIAAYLAFFPVTINTLRGLQSPAPAQVEFMRSIAAPPAATLWYLRLPAALPHLFSGLRLAATASVIGAIVGEVSAGTGNGIGRGILNFTYYYSTGPEKLFAAVLVASLAGIVFVQAIGLLESFTLRNRQR
ncbi:hypothetical protein GCM10010191_63270 [Actinomadura vinacea]|uniref:ABC transmembrane type-1 domain-containing protein n=1 Tax=Actinomadura vinacea TaxID=115336 RepID=A0ABP5X190_9ACTN